MARILTPHEDNPNDSPNDSPDPVVPIRITVPVEYTGFALGQINRHNGIIKFMDAQHGCQVVQATLPASQFDSLSHAIQSFTEKGKVEYTAE